MANAKIKKIKLGATTYDLCDADALHSHQAIKQDGIIGATVNRYGTCTTAAATAAKAVSITAGTFKLEAGARVVVKFSYKNTANTPTLNVNITGAKAIYHNGAQITTGSNKALLAGTVEFVYDGTQWQLIGNYVDTNKSHTLSSGVKADGTTEIVGASSSSKLTLGASGVASGTYGPSEASSAAVNGSITVPEIIVNDKGIVTSAANRTMTLPSISIPNKANADTADLVYAVSNLVESGTSGHTITPTYSGLPTKAYVDKVATGHVKYLGTATAITSLATTAGQGDFYRVSTEFAFGSETAHVGDILLATKDNPTQNTTDWDLIHTEVNTNTWTANTKANAGFVAAGGSNANTVWKTDASGNPAWGKLGEACLAWGGQHISGGISPVGASLSAEHSANRLAYLNPAALVFESSDNAGSTWTTLSWSNESKVKHVTTSESLYIGAAPTVTTSHCSRMTITAQNGSLNPAYVYTRPRKLLINMSTNGHGVAVTVEYKTGTSGAAWQTLCTQNLSGWSGWNEIDVSSIPHLGGGSSQTSNVWYWRLTYKVTSVNSNATYKSARPYIIGLRLFGETCWARTSNMGETGHLYSYDWQQNATFPANVSATTFIGNVTGNVTGNLVGNATTATSATTAGSATTATTASKLSNTSAIGSTTKPVYFTANGVPAACTYSLSKSVPSNAVFTDTDTKVNVTLGTTTKAYLLGVSTTPTTTATGMTAIADTGVYLDTTAGKLTATTFKGNLEGNATTATSATTAASATTATTATNVAWSGITSKPSYYDAKAIKSITRSGKTFTYTCLDNSTGTFDQQDSTQPTKAQVESVLTGTISSHSHAAATLSGTVTNAVGGIAKNKVYNNADISTILSDLLFPYVKPSGLSISTTASSGTKEYGTTVAVTKVTPSFTLGSKPITSVKIGTTSGGSDLYSGTTATSGTAITLTTSKTFNGTTGGTIYCTISDGTNSISGSTAVSYTYYAYSKLTNSTSASTSGATKQSNSDADNTYSYSSGQYLWLYSRSSGKKIQQYISGTWSDVNTTSGGSLTLTLASGATATYYAYRTDKFTASGSARYKLA